LDRAQAQSATALAAARTADSRRAEAERLAGVYKGRAREALSRQDVDGQRRWSRLERSKRQEAVDEAGRVGGQRRVVEAAVADRDRAARAAISRIEQVTSADGLDDSWWDRWGAAVVSLIARVAEVVACVAGVLALVLCWVPVLGQALLAIAAIAGVVAALANVVLAATGERSWGEAIISIAFAALGCVGLGGARGILSALRGGAGLVTGGRTAITAAFAAGRLQVGQRLSRMTMNLLRRNFGGWQGIMAVGRAGERASGVVKNTTQIRLPGFDNFRVPDGLDDFFLREVKNCEFLELSGRVAGQFDMFAKYAAAQAPPLKFVLHVRSYTQFGPKMEQFIRSNNVIVTHIDDFALARDGLKEFGSMAWKGVKSWMTPGG
jgi:hypothetical protein